MYISLSLGKIEESRQINNEKEKTEQDVSLYLSFFLELSLYASVYIKAVILLKISFLILHSEKKLKLLLIPGLFHILILITFLPSVS